MSEQVNASATEMYGKIVVIKRTGEDSASFELIDESYTFGRAAECDIRIQLLSIAEEHAKICRNEHGQAVLVKYNEDCLININNMEMKESSRVLEHNDIITLVERSFRYQFTPEMLARAQLATQCASSPSGTIPLAGETPKKPSSLSASVFSVSELPSSPVTPKTPVPATRPASTSVSSGQSPMVSTVVDSEITTSPKLSPKMFKLEGEALMGVCSPFNIVGASSLGTSVVSSTDEHKECNKENVKEISAEVSEAKKSEEPFGEDVNANETVSEPCATEAACENVTEAAYENVTEAVCEFACEPIESNAEVVCESACEPIESIAEVVCETVTESVNEVVNEVVSESVTEVICESVSEPTFEFTIEPVCESTAETVREEPSENVVTETPSAEILEQVASEPMAVEECDVVTESVVESTEPMVCDSEIVNEVAVEQATCETDVYDAVMESAEVVAEPTETVVEANDVEMTETVTADTVEPMICEQTEEIIEESVAAPVAEDCNDMDCQESSEKPETVEAAENTEATENVNNEIPETTDVVEVPENIEATKAVAPETCEMDDSNVCAEAPAVESEMTVEEATEAVSAGEPTENKEMEGIEVTEEVIEQQSEIIEAPKSTEEITEISEEKPGEISSSEPETVTEMTEQNANVNNSENVEASEEVAPETAETTEPSETVKADSVEPSEQCEPVTVESANSETHIIEEVTNSNIATQEDDESVPIVELPEDDNEEVKHSTAVELEVLVESEELAAVEIETAIEAVGIESKLASPKRAENGETETETAATSTPLRKSTRVHVTPAALESVKKQQQQQNSPQSTSKRTSSRVTRSRVTTVTTPVSPKNRAQKRQKVDSKTDENENIELSENTNSNPEKKTKTDSNTPVRRSTRARVNQK